MSTVKVTRAEGAVKIEPRAKSSWGEDGKYKKDLASFPHRPLGL